MNQKQSKGLREGTGKRRLRRLLPYAGAILLVLLIIAGLWPKPVPVETAFAQVGPLRATIDEEGKTRVKQRYTISAPVSGQLRRIPFKAGAEVRANETVVAIIDPAPVSLLDPRARALAEARRDSAAATLEKARANRAFTESELARFQKLFSEKTVSTQELETAKVRRDAAVQDEAAAEGAFRQAQAEIADFESAASGTATNLSPREVKSPISGRILRVLEESARVVIAGMPLVEVGDPSDLEVVIEVLSRDGAIIPRNARVEFEQWGGTEPLHGRVRWVEPAAFTKVSALGVEEQRVNVLADLLTPPEQRLGVGDHFRVEARIITWENPQALKVPAGALFRRGNEWATFLINNGRAHLRTVKAGRSSGTETEVLEGLKPGDRVIIYPGSKVRDGQRVEPIQV